MARGHRSLSALTLALACVLPAAAPRALAQSSTSCLEGIESLMRDYQAKHLDATGEFVDWPKCCPDSVAAHYPDDHYYADALRGNPHLAPVLVKSLLDALLFSSYADAVYAQFVDLSLPELEGRDPSQSPLQPLSATTFAQMGLDQNTVVSDDNYCEVYRALQAALGKLRYIWLNPDTNGVNGCVQWVPPSGTDCTCRLAQVPGGNPWNDVPCGPGTGFCSCQGTHWNGCPTTSWTGNPNPVPPNDTFLNFVYFNTQADAYSAARDDANCLWNRGWTSCGASAPFVSISISTGWGTTPPSTDVWWIASAHMEARRGRLQIDLNNRPGKAHVYATLERGSPGSSFIQGDPIAGNDLPEAAGAPMNGTKMDGKLRRLVENPIAGGTVAYTQTWGNMPDDDPGTFVPPGPGHATGTPELMASPTPGNVGQILRWAITQPYVFFEPAFDTRPDKERRCGDDCARCLPGDPKLDPTGDNAYWPLGTDLLGNPVGYLQLRGLSGEENCDVKNLKLNAPTPYAVDVYLNPSASYDYTHRASCQSPRTEHPLRQIYVNGDGDTSVDVDIVPQPCVGGGCGFELRYFLSGQRLSANRPYTYTGQPFYRSCIHKETGPSYPDPASPGATGSGSLVRYEVYRDAGLVSRSDLITVGGNTTLLEGYVPATGTFLKATRTIHVPIDSTDRKVVTIITSGTNLTATVSRRVEVYRAFAWGEELIATGSGDDNAELWNTREFHTASATTQDGYNYGRLKLEKDPYGAWTHYDYDAKGRVSLVVRGLQNNTFEAAPSAAANRATEFSYLAIDVDGVSGVDAVEERIDKFEGTAIARSYTVAFAGSHHRVGPSANGKVQWTIRCKDPAAPVSVAAFLQGEYSANMGSGGWGSTANLSSWGSTANDVSETVREEDGKLRVLSSLTKDRTLTWHQYIDLPASGSAISETITYSGLVDDTGVSASCLVLGTRHVRDTTRNHLAVLDATYDLADLAHPLRATTVAAGNIDEFGRALRTDNAVTGLYSTVSYNCCGVESTMSEEGIRTAYEYDALKRVTAVLTQVGGVDPATNTYPATAQISVYDPAGRVVASGRRGSDSSTVYITSSSAYDSAGRLTATADGQGNATTYSESISPSTGYVSRTEILPDPDSTGTGEPCPENVRVYYRDGSLYSVNIPFYDDRSGSAPEWHAEALSTFGGLPAMAHTVHASSTGNFPWRTTYTDALGRVVQTKSSLTSTTSATELVEYASDGRTVTRTDPDGVKTVTVSGRGIAQGLLLFGGAVPGALEDYFRGSWSAQVLKRAAGSSIVMSAAAPNPADRVSLSGSWVTTRSGTPVTRSASIAWNDDTSSTSIIETSRSESSLTAQESWATSFGRTTHTLTAVGLTGGAANGTVTTTRTEPTGAVTTSVNKFGRLAYSTRTNADTSFGGQTEMVYDGLGRVLHSYLYRTAGLTLAERDATDFTYYDGTTDRLCTRTDPSPTDGNTSADRVVTAYWYDHLGRTVQVDAAGSSTFYTFNPRGQVLTVRGYGAYPVDYGYDEQGRMITLTTYDAGAVTSWFYDPYSGRLAAKTYTGHSEVDASYSYTAAGRPLINFGARPISSSHIDTVYLHANTGEVSSIWHNDGTPTVLFQAYDRLGRPSTIVDAAGKHTLTYSDEGELTSDTITADTGIVDAPGLNILAGTKIENTYAAPAGTSFGQVRTAHKDYIGTVVKNTVNFEYDPAARINRVAKSGADAQYAYHPINGQVDTSTFRVLTGSVYTPRFRGTRQYDRLNRLSSINWNWYDGTSLGYLATGRSVTYDAHGQRTAVSMQSDYSYAPREEWIYDYDELGQLVFAEGNFPADAGGGPVPGKYFNYQYDSIGNRTYAYTDSKGYMEYHPNALNQYDSRDVPGVIDVSGQSPAPDVYVYTGLNPTYPAWRGTGSASPFFHETLGFDNTLGPVKTTVNVLEVPGGVSSHDQFMPATPEDFSYDEDGNLIQDGLWDYEFDADNRLKAMTLKADVAAYLLSMSDTWLRLEFAYDYMGRRISKRLLRSSTNLLKVSVSEAEYKWDHSYWQKFLYDGWNLSTTLRCNSQTGQILGPDQTFAWGPDLSATEQGAGGIGGLAIYVDDYNDGGGGSGVIGAMSPMYDANGNVVELFDGAWDTYYATANRMAAYTYDPFGEEQSKLGPQATRFPFRWSTKYADEETGLVYYGYRYYSSSMGCWISRDPIEEHGGMRLYGFVGNAPVGSVDPNGQHPLIAGIIDGYEIYQSAAEWYGAVKGIAELLGQEWDVWPSYIDIDPRVPQWFKWQSKYHDPGPQIARSPWPIIGNRASYRAEWEGRWRMGFSLLPGAIWPWEYAGMQRFESNGPANSTVFMTAIWLRISCEESTSWPTNDTVFRIRWPSGAEVAAKIPGGNKMKFQLRHKMTAHGMAIADDAFRTAAWFRCVKCAGDDPAVPSD